MRDRKTAFADLHARKRAEPMKMIAINIHKAGGAAPKQVQVAEDAVISDVLKLAEVADEALGELEEEISFLIENEHKLLKRGHRLVDCGVRHGHNVHVGAVLLIVNTREKKWYGKRISYDEVIKLAFPDHKPSADVVYTVDYSHGPEHHRTGSLVKGQSVKVKCGMIFNVTPTNKS